MPGFGVDFATEIHRSLPREQVADAKGAAPTESARAESADCGPSEQTLRLCPAPSPSIIEILQQSPVDCK